MLEVRGLLEKSACFSEWKDIFVFNSQPHLTESNAAFCFNTSPIRVETEADLSLVPRVRVDHDKTQL